LLIYDLVADIEVSLRLPNSDLHLSVERTIRSLLLLKTTRRRFRRSSELET